MQSLLIAGADADEEFLKDVGSSRGKNSQQKSGGSSAAGAEQTSSHKSEKIGLLNESSTG